MCLQLPYDEDSQVDDDHDHDDYGWDSRHGSPLCGFEGSFFGGMLYSESFLRNGLANINLF